MKKITLILIILIAFKTIHAQSITYTKSSKDKRSKKEQSYMNQKTKSFMNQKVETYMNPKVNTYMNQKTEDFMGQNKSLFETNQNPDGLFGKSQTETIKNFNTKTTKITSKKTKEADNKDFKGGYKKVSDIVNNLEKFINNLPSSGFSQTDQLKTKIRLQQVISIAKKADKNNDGYLNYEEEQEYKKASKDI